MGGPKVKQQKTAQQTAQMPALFNPLQGVLQNFLSTGQSPFNQPSALQQQAGNSWQQVLGNLGSMGGQGVIDAAQPVFQRNMQMGADVLRQSGPRFNTNTERLVADQGGKAMQDFNLFSQQAMQAGQQNQLAALTGAGNFGNEVGAQQGAFLHQLLGMSGQMGAGQSIFMEDPGLYNKILAGVQTGANVVSAIKGGGSGKPAGGTARSWNGGREASF